MKKNNLWYFVIYTAITLIFFGMLFKMEYATDTYSVFNFNSDEIYMQFAMSGRFVTAIVGKLVKLANIPEKMIYFNSFVFALFCIVLSQYKLYKIIDKDVKSKILKIIIPPLVVANIFSIELFLYIEKGIMCFAVLMCIFALQSLIKFWENGKEESKKRYLNIAYAIIFMFIANCSYQGVVRNICVNCFSIYSKIF